MKFYNLASKNVKGNLYRYIMYYFSNVFSVMLFFIFANFVYHPAVSSLKSSQDSMLYTISKGIGACQYVIIVFTFFFVNYSNSTFIKSRSREFGLLSMFGMTKGQIRKYVAYENIIVSLLSILGGILLGGLFSKLFFMAVESTLGTGAVINFMIVPKAAAVTAASFLILFQIINIFSLRRINNKTIVTQLKAAKAPKPAPSFSWKLALLGVVLVAAGYIMAWFSGMAIIITMFPILFVTILGTYFLFTQFSVAITTRLQKNKSIFYKKTNMVILSQIIYKLRDNAKVFFLIAILGAVTLTAAGTLCAIFSETQKTIVDKVPQHIAFLENGLESHNVIDPSELENTLKSHDINILSQYKIVTVKGTWSYTDSKTKKASSGNVLAISCTDYNKRAKALKMKELKINTNKIELVKLNAWTKGPMSLSYNINGPIAKEQLAGSIYGRLMSTDYVGYDYIAVLSDDYFNSMVKKTTAKNLMVYYGYDIENWKSREASDAVEEISAKIPTSYKKSFFEVISGYAAGVKSSVITTMIGLFIALLFLIATGSMIYFKLFSELQQDRAEFISLKKMGMTKGEMNKIINTQMVIIFFLPFIIACSHASFALKTLSDLLQENLVSVGLTVISVYFVFQIIYYFIIRLIYKGQLKTI
jgi:putative ABC transport system permease protein